MDISEKIVSFHDSNRQFVNCNHFMVGNRQFVCLLICLSRFMKVLKDFF